VRRPNAAPGGSRSKPNAHAGTGLRRFKQNRHGEPREIRETGKVLVKPVFRMVPISRFKLGPSLAVIVFVKPHQ